ncbi:DUF1634 domain-containing protein [Chitinophagaceae bacterium LWZ2-11]
MKKTLHDKDIQTALGTLLRTGVILSSIVVLIGAVIYIYRHGQETANFHTFHGDTGLFRTFPDIIKGFFEGKGRAIIQMGILVLIATPIARIIFSIFGFLFEKDYLYVTITLIVLAIILISLFSGAKI